MWISCLIARFITYQYIPDEDLPCLKCTLLRLTVQSSLRACFANLVVR